MSPILVRPVREQLEHDRVIRLLQAKYKRKFEVAINPGNEQTLPVGTGPSAWYPDLVLQSSDRGRKLLGVVEVETAESVNNLEAMSQWAALSKLRAPFHLYIPTTSVDSARRLCADLRIPVAELWAYATVGDQLRFTLVQRVPGSEPKVAKPAAEPAPARTKPAPPRAAAASKAATPARTAANGPSRGSQPAVRRAATPVAVRKAVAKAKNGSVRRRPAKPVARKASSSGSSRAQKRK